MLSKSMQLSFVLVALVSCGPGGAAQGPATKADDPSGPAPAEAGHAATEAGHAAEWHAHAPGDHGHAAGAGAEPLGHRFEHAEDWVARFDDPERTKWQKPRSVIALMSIAPGMTVADIGAGTGYFTAHLSRAVGPDGKVLALDIEPDMVRHLTERAARDELTNVTARRVTPTDPGLAAGSVDRILIVNTWHHIPERKAYAARLAAALAPGGAIYVVDYKRDSPRGPPREHRLAPEVVTAELASAGLEVTVDADALPYQYIAIARARPAR